MSLGIVLLNLLGDGCLFHSHVQAQFLQRLNINELTPKLCAVAKKSTIYSK